MVDEELVSANANAVALPIWLKTTLDDAHVVSFESPILGSLSAECMVLRDLYTAAVQALEDAPDYAQTPALRVFYLLAAVTGMFARPSQPHDPFGPFMQLADGSRTPVPVDFRQHVDVLADLAVRTKHPVLRARLCDVCWLLDRTRGQLGLAAVEAYNDIVERTARGELAYRFASEPGALQSEAAHYLRRALEIGRSVGWDKPAVAKAKATVARLRVDAIAAKRHAAVRWFCSLDLDYSVSGAAGIGDALSMMLANADDPSSALSAVDLWKLAGRAYARAKDEESTYRAQSEAAECLVAHAMAQDGSAMLKAHFLSNAIAALHGIPGMKGRRNSLRHQLIEVQAGVAEEMGVLSEPIDLKAMAVEVQRVVGDADLLDMLFLVADLGRSPDVAVLDEDAKKRIRASPFTSMFGTAHLDRQGKVLSRTDAAGLGDDANDSAVQHQIAQAERMRRQVFVHGQIEPALQVVRDRHHVSDESLVALLQFSPVVPNDLLETIARGFTCFIQGECVSATYILTPLLESLLRYLLKGHGYDVTVFDDATETQKDRTISQLFEQMRPELELMLSANITADLDRVFLRKPGPSLRHAVAHGLLHDGDPYGSDARYCCWLMFRLCLLPLFARGAEVRSNLGGAL
jgi:hypothetical protein